MTLALVLRDRPVTQLKLKVAFCKIERKQPCFGAQIWFDVNRVLRSLQQCFSFRLCF